MYYTEDSEGDVKIYWGGRIYYCFNREDAFAKRVGIALLADLGVLRKTICSFFQVTRNTVAKVLGVYKSLGLEGLRSYRPGPKGVEEGLKGYVIKRYIELQGERGYQKRILEEVESKAREGIFRKGISRSKLQKIIREYKDEIEEERERAEGEAEEEARVEEKGEEEYVGELSEGEEQCVDRGGAAIAIPF
ncbi:MAG: hypothetical protein GTO54_03170, partial [Nitrososphaeria archaeon]|nr:hypothetical protein [Nitrososphaeria archaeon]